MTLRLQNLRIKTRLLLLCFVMLAGSIVCGAISFHAVTEIEVNGPVYQRIVQGKNLIADILPSSAYILESYLTMMQIGDETNREKQKILAEKFMKLREEYYERYEFWRKTLPDGPMREIVKKSHDPAAAFYEKVEKEFLPAVLSGNRNRVKAVKSELNDLYDIHRAAVDELVRLADNRNSTDEALAASLIRNREILLLAVACTMMAAIIVAFLGIRQMLTNNVLRLVSVTERFSSGDLTARSGLQGKDEFSEVGRAFDQMADKIERDSIALKESEEDLKRHRDHLEDLVNEKTEELTKVNEQLRLEITDRKRAENAFRESEEKFRSMIETTSDWIWEVDRKGFYTYASPKIRELLGYEPEEVIGRSPFDLMPPDEAKRVAGLFGEIVASRKPIIGLENVNRHKDGRYVVLESSGVPIFDTKGNLSGYRGIDRDITERRQVEEALKESEERFSKLANSTWEGIIIHREGMILDANESISKMLGYNDEEIIGHSVLEFLAPESIELALQKLRESIDTPQIYLEAMGLKKDKTVFHVEVLGRPIRYKNFDARVMAIRDITERKRAEDDLFRERNQLQSLLNIYRRADMRLHDIEAFIIQECVRITESPLAFFGLINEDETLMMTTMWSEKAMEGCAVDFKALEFSLGHAGIWAEAIREHKPLIVNDYSMPDHRKKGYPEGHVPIQRLMSIPVVKGSKAVAVLAVANKKTDYEEKNIPHLSLFLESMWDMIMRKKAEEELHTLNEQLEQKVEEKTSQLLAAQQQLIRREKLAILGRLAGIVGHEIRNPLGVMNNAVYFLKTVMTDATDTVKEYLDIIKQEIDNSQRIITDLLDFARTKTPQMTPVAVNELVIKVLGKYAVAGNIDVQTDITEALPEVKVDSFQMGQVLRNLITNAVQAMPGGGSLRISAREVQGARRKVQGRDEEKLEPSTLNLEPDTDFVEISVKDTGEGISPENMEKLFQPLFTTKTKGIGLGLTICKNLTEANGGRIEVESRLGIGTTFKIIIPIGG